MVMNLIDLIQAGTIDVRLPSVSPLASDDDRSAALNSTGVLTVIGGAFQVDRLAAALIATTGKCTSLEGQVTQQVETRHVLAQPWNYNRMVSAITARREERPAGPIEVMRVSGARLPTLYIVLAGEHEVFAARQAGDEQIPVQILGDYQCDFQNHFIQSGHLMDFSSGELTPVSPEEPWSGAAEWEDAKLAPDVMQIIQALGVRVIASDRSDQDKRERANGHDNDG